MSQKLTELLEQISPLPWTSEPISRTTLRQREANELYRVHSANSLPELVAASREFQYSVLRNGSATQAMITRLQKAIADTEEIKDAPDALTTSDKTPTVNTL